MSIDNTYDYRTTTSQQRQLLFKTWQETGSIAKACHAAQVSRSTFYYWRERFEKGGYPALEEERSHAPKNPRRIDPDLEELIIHLKREHPEWGKLRLSKAIKDKHTNITLSPNTVRRVLVGAELWR